MYNNNITCSNFVSTQYQYVDQQTRFTNSSLNNESFDVQFPKTLFFNDKVSYRVDFPQFPENHYEVDSPSNQLSNPPYQLYDTYSHNNHDQIAYPVDFPQFPENHYEVDSPSNQLSTPPYQLDDTYSPNNQNQIAYPVKFPDFQENFYEVNSPNNQLSSPSYQLEDTYSPNNQDQTAYPVAYPVDSPEFSESFCEINPQINQTSQIDDTYSHYNINNRLQSEIDLEKKAQGFYLSLSPIIVRINILSTLFQSSPISLNFDTEKGQFAFQNMILKVYQVATQIMSFQEKLKLFRLMIEQDKENLATINFDFQQFRKVDELKISHLDKWAETLVGSLKFFESLKISIGNIEGKSHWLVIQQLLDEAMIYLQPSRHDFNHSLPQVNSLNTQTPPNLEYSRNTNNAKECELYKNTFFPVKYKKNHNIQTVEQTNQNKNELENNKTLKRKICDINTEENIKKESVKKRKRNFNTKGNPGKGKHQKLKEKLEKELGEYSSFLLPIVKRINVLCYLFKQPYLSLNFDQQETHAFQSWIVTVTRVIASKEDLERFQYEQQKLYQNLSQNQPICLNLISSDQFQNLDNKLYKKNKKFILEFQEKTKKLNNKLDKRILEIKNGNLALEEKEKHILKIEEENKKKVDKVRILFNSRQGRIRATQVKKLQERLIQFNQLDNWAKKIVEPLKLSQAVKMMIGNIVGENHWSVIQKIVDKAIIKT